ncbi:hypothetical protein [Pseudoalteromonas sp.]|nr:hypothetical protein [Pseudoalteromonas sp.]
MMDAEFQAKLLQIELEMLIKVYSDLEELKNNLSQNGPDTE